MKQKIIQETWMKDTATGGAKEEGHATFKYFMGRGCQWAEYIYEAYILECYGNKG